MTTLAFKVGASIYTKIVFANFFAKYWWCYTALIILLSSLIVINLNFLVVLLALIFIVYPMSVSFVYFSYCITKEIIWSVSEKKISIIQEGLQLDFGNSRKILQWSNFKKGELQKGYFILTLKKRKFCYLIIPVEAIPTDKDFQYFTTQLSANINKSEVIC